MRILPIPRAGSTVACILLNSYIILDILVCSIAVFLYELCCILT